MRLHIIIYIAIAMLMLAACSSEEKDELTEGTMAHVTMNIATRAATGTPESPTIDAEKIHTWWVAFVDKNGKVQKIVTRPSSDSYVEEEQLEFDIPTGTYTVYAFANIAQSAVTSAGYTFTEGTSYPSGIDAATWTLNNDYSGDIPMTGRQSVRVTGRTNEVFSIEVVRMYAKVDIEYENVSKKNVTINSLTIHRVEKNPVPLFPDYDYLSNGWTFGNQGTAATNFDRTYSTPKVLTASTGKASDMFYMIESQADYSAPSQSYLLTLNIERQGDSPENLYFMLDENWKSIYRNDHIVLPLTITDYTVELDANFYPPIGGFPAIITHDKDREEFYCEFATQGEFEILPRVHNKHTGSTVYHPGWDYVTGSLKVASVTGAAIFSVAPHIDPVTGELLGTLNTAEGTACITLQVKVRTATSPEEVWQIYPRRIYITRKNPS